MIIGAGLAGLATAIGLAQRGFRVRVYEQSTVLRELGAGLTLRPSAMKVFEALGCWERIREVTSTGGSVFVHYQTLEILPSRDSAPSHDWTRRPATPEEGGHSRRAEVHAILVDELRRLDPDAVVLGARLQGFTQDATGVHARFENGAVADADLLIGADGIRSVALQTILGREYPARFTGVIAIRCLIPRTPAVEPFLGGGRMVKYVGPGRGLNRYGVSGGSLINCVALAATGSWREEGWNHPCSREEFLELYRDFHRDVTGLIEQAPAQDIFKWALYDREPLETWTRGRATLIGDAAHPMLPYLGQGATTALEDALVLVRALEAYDDHEEAFRVYEADRIPLATARMLAARAQGEALNQPDPRAYGRLRPDTRAIDAYDPVAAEL
jgi:salicylate hydroxylase